MRVSRYINWSLGLKADTDNILLYFGRARRSKYWESWSLLSVKRWLNAMIACLVEAVEHCSSEVCSADIAIYDQNAFTKYINDMRRFSARRLFRTDFNFDHHDYGKNTYVT